MYNSFRTIWEKVLRIPPDPEPPPGDERTARLFRAAPNFYKYLLITWALGTFGIIAAAAPSILVPLLAAGKGVYRHHTAVVIVLTIPGTVIALLLIWRVIALALVRLDFEKRWYLVTDRSLRVREGIVSVREMTVTFANIQNISISQGPIQRAIGIADLRVDTAGGGSGAQDRKHPQQNLHTAWFRGVSNADEIRSLIQDRLHRLKDAGLGDRDDRPPPGTPADIGMPVEVLVALRAVAEEAARLRQALAA